MALKTVIKLTLGKYGILSTEMQQAVTRDQAVITSDEHGDMTYVDNEATASAPVYAEPEIPEDAPLAEPEQAAPASDGVPSVDDMKKPTLIAAVGVHKDAPYFETVFADYMLDGERDINKYPVSILRDLVTGLREAEAQA